MSRAAGDEAVNQQEARNDSPGETRMAHAGRAAIRRPCPPSTTRQGLVAQAPGSEELAERFAHLLISRLEKVETIDLAERMQAKIGSFCPGRSRTPWSLATVSTL
jgi:hypothetical protein